MDARRQPLRAAVEILSAWQRHRTGRNVAVVTHYAFMAVLPGLLALTSLSALLTRVSGISMETLQEEIFGRIPLVGEQLRAYAQGQVAGEVGSLLLGTALALWGSLRALSAVMEQNDDIWEVPGTERLGPGRRRVKALGSLLRIGGGFVLAVAASAIILTPLPAAAGATGLLVGGIVNTFAVRGLLRLSSFRQNGSGVRRGAVIGGLSFTVLQVGGAAIVRMLSGGTTGPLGPTFALVAWLGLHATVLAVSAEISARDTAGNSDTRTSSCSGDTAENGPGRAGDDPSHDIGGHGR